MRLAGSVPGSPAVTAEVERRAATDSACVLRAKSTRADLPTARVLPLTSFTSGRASFASFAPDGKELAFTWNGDKGSEIEHLYVQLIGSETPVQLTAAGAIQMSRLSGNRST